MCKKRGCRRKIERLNWLLSIKPNMLKDGESLRREITAEFPSRIIPLIFNASLTAENISADGISPIR